MKKAYVKPVFMADEYELTASVAGCARSYGDPVHVYVGRYACNHENNGHTIGKGQSEVNAYWDYATAGRDANGSAATPDSEGNYDQNTTAYLFTDGQQVCDFVWNTFGTGVGVWKDKETNSLISNYADRDIELKTSFIDYVADSFMSFFRGNGSGCAEVAFDGAVPFS